MRHFESALFPIWSLVNHCHPFYKRFHWLIDWSFLFWEWYCLSINKYHIALAGLCLSLSGIHIFMFKYQWGNSQCCKYTVSVFSLMLLSAAKMKLGKDGQYLKGFQVTSRQWEVGERLCRGVEAMLTLPHTALISSFCPEFGQRGSNDKQKALNKQLDVVAVIMCSGECWTNQHEKQQTGFFSCSIFPCFV